MQPADFDLDSVNVLARGTVKTEQTLYNFSGDLFRSLAQSTHSTSVCYLRELRFRAGQLWVFRILAPSMRTRDLALL